MWRETKILLIDDDSDRRRDVAIILDFLGEDHLSTGSGEWREAVAELSASRELTCVLLGSTEARGGCVELIKQLAAWDDCLPVSLLGQEGAHDCPKELRKRILATLDLPLTYNALVDSMHRAQSYREMYDEVRGSSSHRDLSLFRSLVGTSRPIQRIRQLMQQVAETEANVLILGEANTGKEVIARNLHYNSKRREAPFVPLNCGAIPAELLESELFGHVPGAFPGAITDRAGRLELAKGGTLFLDEIDELSPLLQVKLLRALDEQIFERAGSDKPVSADVRIIAATSSDLEALVGSGKFREDLYYRLNVFPIEMPALRERTEDIPLLLNELISRLEHEKRGSIRFNSAAILSLCQHSWPGNIRELANLVERMAIMHPYGVIGVAELPIKFRHVVEQSQQAISSLREHLSEREAMDSSLKTPLNTTVLPAEGIDLKDYLGNLEQALIQQALDEATGVVARAAERLRIRRTTLVEKMRKYGMTRRDEGNGDEDESHQHA